MMLAVAIVAVFALAGCGSGGGPGPERLTFPGSNMEPTLERGSTVVVTPVGAGYAPRRGDIVEFTDPGRWLDGLPSSGQGRLISRVVATAGDEIICCAPDGRLEIDGRTVAEPYLDAPHGRCAAELPRTAGWKPCDWKVGPVPAGAVFVLGDNRVDSADSRMHMCPPRARHCAPGPWVPVPAIVGTIQAP